MNILSAEVNWWEGCLNRPTLTITVDRMPKRNEVSHKCIDDGSAGSIYYGELDGFVSFLLHDPGNESGYSGRSFDLRMENNSIRTIKGPWSSRAGVMNRLGLGPCVNVTIRDSSYPGSCLFAGAVTLEVAQQAAEMAGARMVLRDSYGEPVYEPYNEAELRRVDKYWEPKAIQND